MQLFDDCAVLDQSTFYGYHHSDHLNGRCQPKLSRGTVYDTDSARNPCYYHQQQLKLAKNSSFLSRIDSDILTKFRYPDKRDNLTLFYQLFMKSITTVKSFPFERNLKGSLKD